MLLTITTTHAPATDLGFLLHKHPDRVQEFPQSFGTATVFYPEAGQERCTAALMLQVDPVRLARTLDKNRVDFSLAQYVNDRSYAASSLLAVALGKVFSTARSGRCDTLQDLADSAIALEISVPALPCRGGAEITQRIFEPLGWSVQAVPVPLDPEFPEWGDSRYIGLRLTGTQRLAEALNQLYVLLPALDESKHYWQSPEEVDKLISAGTGWLAEHPERELITRRYLGRSRRLLDAAQQRLRELDDASSPEDEPFEELPEPPPGRTPLNVQRQQAVLDVLRELGVHRVIDLGCGPGALLARLVEDPIFTTIAGCDVSTAALRQAGRTLHLDRMSDQQRQRIELFQAALTYADERLGGYDAAILMEVIEHVDLPRLPALEKVVFGTACPASVVVTTPNREFNVVYGGQVRLRHRDHRFEWTRGEFSQWVRRVGDTYGYAAEIRGVGEHLEELGSPTQMAVFTRAGVQDD
ncbi:3' terminal RNA ribose 2'-O-methyltransferase Hen1 [Nesterenkonia muleiensis]|uniref:3' terminal RNA ribose 2'-O-methyltransferase Hen1 n=1 Tax=Nesterenkonia muleiensis TaxID=2282648 RepID=UPI000E74C1B2|nr:3' terminal RNA ribose 2'-O-methyltransferase Hen1 [Nesterenkonia muleiensis]